MASDERLGTGASITFVTSAHSCKIRNINMNDFGRDAVEKTHMASSGGREYTPTQLPDPGELELEALFNPDNPPPYTAAPETIRLTFPVGSGTAAKMEGTGFITKCGIVVPLEEMMSQTIRIKFTGALTFTDAS